MGAVAAKAGLYVLPATDQCIEALQWLAQEAQTTGADPIIMHVEAFEGLPDTQLVDLFLQARNEDYAVLAERLTGLNNEVTTGDSESVQMARSALGKLRDEFQQIRQIDFFNALDGPRVASSIDALSRVLAEPDPSEPEIPRIERRDYIGRRWVTRPRPFVDRLACAWLIRRFIDPTAEIIYRDAPGADEVAFDMSEGAFGHVGNRCAFEVMVTAFVLTDPGLSAIAEIVHEIDLHDGRYVRPEVTGIEAVLEGWRGGDWPDEVIEAAGGQLFDGVYMSLRAAETHAAERDQRP